MIINVCDVPTEKVLQLPDAAKILIIRGYNGLTDICFNADFAFRGTNPCYARNKDTWHFETINKFKFDLNPDEIGSVYFREDR